MTDIKPYGKLKRLIIVTGLLIFLWISAICAVYGAWHLYVNHLARLLR
jgi:hypothetical protein